jgi:translation initiation factor IF-2
MSTSPAASVSTVLRIYKINRITGPILGCSVESGELRLGARARLVRRGAVVWEGSVTSLRLLEAPVAAVAMGSECGVMLTPAEAPCAPDDRLETFDE